MPVPFSMTLEARPEAVLSASAGGAATSAGAGNPLGASGTLAAGAAGGGGGGVGFSDSFLQEVQASRAMKMTVEM